MESEEAGIQEVGMLVRIRYRGDPDHWNPDDVVFLARSGIESHYDVVEILWDIEPEELEAIP